MPNKNENLRRRKIQNQLMYRKNNGSSGNMSIYDEYELLIQENDNRSSDSRSIRRKIQDKGKGSPNSGLFFSFLCLVVTVTILIAFFSVYTDSLHPIVDTIASHLGYSEKQYGAIIDAGSTGSRVLAFEFHKGYLDGRLVLDNELFKELKPGLSSLTPPKGKEQIAQLLDEAKHFIPEEYWASSPVALKATAGLRLLGPEQSEEILNAIRDLFAVSGFSVNENSVEIMDGTDEGIFSWFTVNYLSGRLTSRNTVAALDLGGGSTQVTYELNEFQPSYKDYIHAVPIFGGSEVNVFTNSYLGLGLMALRHAVITYQGKPNQTSFENECVNSIIKDKPWNYAKVDYLISGKENKRNAENPEVDYDTCVQSVKRQVQPLLTPKPIKLSEHTINAFSYFYDRAIETGLVDPFQGGEIAVAEFAKKSREVCANANADQPFMCLDLVYITVLLQDGYGLKPQTPIKLFKKIRGHEVSWALGCFFQNYNDLQKKQKRTTP